MAAVTHEVGVPLVVDKHRGDALADPPDRVGDRCGGAFRHQLDPSYHGLVYARDLGVNGDFGVNRSFIHKARVQLLRDLGSAVAPFSAWLIAQGLETLSLRIERHTDGGPDGGPLPCGMRVLEWLVPHPERVATALMVGTTAALGADQIGSHQAQIEAIRTSALFAVA